MPYIRRIVTIALLCSTFNLISCATPPIKHNNPWFGKDKAVHFAVSTALAAGLTAAAKEHDRTNCDAALVGFSVSLAIGAGKESYDKRIKKTRYSYRDMVWNMAGATVGSVLASGCH